MVPTDRIAIFWFEVPFRGSLPGLFLGGFLYMLSSLGIGPLISRYASTRQQAMLPAFFVITPR